MIHNKYNIPAARRAQIVAWLAEEGALSISELENRLGVSHMTVHRDLQKLADQNRVRKVRGGAVPVSTTEQTAPTYRLCALCGGHISARSEVVISTTTGQQLSTCCPHCALLLIADRNDVESALARDYLYGRMVNVFSASYVIDSEIVLCCVPSTICFASLTDATRFEKGFHGRILDFASASNFLQEAHQHHVGAN